MENPKETPDIRTLLQEARAAIVKTNKEILAAINEAGLCPLYKEYHKETAELAMDYSTDDLLHRIDSALAAPEPGAMELVEKIRGADSDDYNFYGWHLTDTEAAALIEQYGHRVVDGNKTIPRAMINDLYRLWEQSDDEPSAKVEASIAARYGVRIEEEGV